MARSRDWDELQHTWVEWRRQTGQYVKDLYDQMVDLTNEAAKLNSKSNALTFLILRRYSDSIRDFSAFRGFKSGDSSDPL